MAAPGSTKPEVGEILLVIHDFQARSSDELSLAKGDRVELIERDDEFGDGWFLGKHLVNGNSGLFPEVYTRLAPKTAALNTSISSTPKQVLTPLAEVANEPSTPPLTASFLEETKPVSTPSPKPTPTTLPLNSVKSPTVTSSPASPFSMSTKSLPTLPGSGIGSLGRLNSSQDSQVLHETLNVINEHITDLSSAQSNGARNTDSGSEYSSHLDHRMSYIQGEETDEEEDPSHSRIEVEVWSADQVAEYLFTQGVEKHHCEVFRDQEITGEILLGMDQTSLFIKAFDLGSVGRRLKTWQKIKQLQDEVNGMGTSTRRTTQTYGSDAGSDAAGRIRSRTNTMTSSGQHQHRFSPLDGRSLSAQTKRMSQTPKLEPIQPMTPVSPTALIDSPTRPLHEKRPSAASIRDLHHSRRHSSTDFRLTGTTLSAAVTPKLGSNGTFPQSEVSHKKQPSFDRNWTLGSATAYAQRPQSSAGFHESMPAQEQELQDSAVDLDRGYFSGTDADGRRRNVLRKRDSSSQTGFSSPKTSYAEEQRVRSATALSRHSRFGSVGSTGESGPGTSPAAQKYYGLTARRSASTATTDSLRPVPPSKDSSPPAVTKLDSNSPDRSSPKTAIKRLSQVNHPDFNVTMMWKSGLGGLRAASETITGSDRSKIASPTPIDSPLKDSPMYSPARTGSSTPSAGPSFELADEKSPSATAAAAAAAAKGGARKKTKKETSAYTRGLLKMTPREAMMDADYSGWMKKKSSNLMTTWKPRLFILKGRRLAYYYSEDDDQEKGLIDISFHRVLPADNERLTGLHATLTGAGSSPAFPAGSHVPTLAATEAEKDPVKESDAMFIFKLVPPRAGLSRAVNFTKPTVHYFAVPNIKQGRLWMAALMKATIDRDDTQPITTSYQQKTISLAKARQMRHRPPALMNLDEKDGEDATNGDTNGAEKDNSGLDIVYSAVDSGAAALEKLGLSQAEGARTRGLTLGDERSSSLPQSA
ncbi:protein BOI2 [Diplogelasinospora grovesii]|uniref:Protein BOI2 n=1 Tax=Diplogelasinospora grovesii TaxID=303347 RepID=A0AAN6SA12_9PEZI|nr:protein BOI2 [Diplogelasinospora grovesii]